MKTSRKGRDLIVAREGKRLLAYRDSVGVWTIGVGHTGRMAPPPVTPGMRITDAQSDAFLAADLAPVERMIDSVVKVPMTQNEYDAMASLGFNIGVNGLARSMVVRKLNLGDVKGAADAFMGWSKPAVLVGRRKAERAQFLTPDSPQVVAQRVATLIVRSEAKAASSKADTKLAAGAAVAATAIVVAQPVASQHHTLFWVAFVLVGALAIGAGIAALLNRRKSKTLAVNAAAHETDLQNFDAGAADTAAVVQE